MIENKPKRLPRSDWSEIEKETIRQHFPHKSTLLMMELLPGRPETNISAQAQRMGVRKSKERFTQSKQEWIERQNTNPIKRKYTCNERYFETIDTPEKAYWLGWMWSDGSVDDNKWRVRLYLNEIDEYIVREFKKAINATNPIDDDRRQVDGIVGLHINSKKMVLDLIKLRVVPDKCHKQEMPIISNELLRFFILGLFDGDGSIFVKGNDYRIQITGTKAVTDWLLDTTHNVLKIDGGGIYKGSGDYAWNFVIGGRLQVAKFAQWMYKDCSFNCKRKYDEFIKYDLFNENIIGKPRPGAWSFEEDLLLRDKYPSCNTRDIVGFFLNRNVNSLLARARVLGLSKTTRKFSDETRRRMSESQKGNKKWLGRHHSQESIKKMSDIKYQYWSAKQSRTQKVESITRS